MAAAVDPLERLLDGRIATDSTVIPRFIDAILASGKGIAAVILYGSRLSSEASTRSEPDFYVVVDSLWRYQRGLGKFLLSLFLPPSTYHVQLPPEACPERLAGLLAGPVTDPAPLPMDPSGGDPAVGLMRHPDAGSSLWSSVERSAKLCVISRAQLLRETSARASDLHHLGRFSKAISLVYCRDEATREMIRACQRSALLVMSDYVLPLLPPRFSVDEFIRELLSLSYRGEPRIIEPGKIDKLFGLDAARYRAIARLLLAERCGAPRAGSIYARPAVADADRARTHAFIARSRRRALARMPKYLCTFNHWLEYALRKVERNIGRPLPLSDRARKHPLIFGWPQLIAMRRQGLLK